MRDCEGSSSGIHSSDKIICKPKNRQRERPLKVKTSHLMFEQGFYGETCVPISGSMTS